MKLFASFLLCAAIMLGIVFAQVGGRQGTEIRQGGGSGGSATNAQPPSAALSNAANNPNLVTNILGAGGGVTVSSNNLGTFTITVVPISSVTTNANQFGVTADGQLTLKSLILLTNELHHGTILFNRIAGGTTFGAIGVDGNNVGTIEMTNGVFITLNVGTITNTTLLTNAILISGPGSIIITGKLAGLTMHPDGTLSNSAPASSSGTNFDKIRLDGEIYNITNAGNNTTVTADWNGDHWMRLQLAGSTIISFTNCPISQPTNGEIYVLELYVPEVSPSLTIQNIDTRQINWGLVGSPQLVDSETNLIIVRFDGTNFLGRVLQDRTSGTITSPYVLQDNSSTSNHTTKGIFSLTNAPGDGAPDLRFKGTNGNSYIELTTIDGLVVTQRLVFSFTNWQAGQVLTINSVASSGGITTTIITNDFVTNTITSSTFIDSNSFIVNTTYTNSQSTPMWVQVSPRLSPTVTETAALVLMIDQEKDGTWDILLTNQIGAVSVVSDILFLGGWVTNGGRFTFTNVSVGAATATIGPNSSQRAYNFGGGSGGAGTPVGPIATLQFKDTNSTFAGTTNLTWDQSQNVLYGKFSGSAVKLQLAGIGAPNETNEMGPSWLRMTSPHDLGIGNNNSNNWLFTAAGDLEPFTGDSHNFGSVTRPLKSIFFTRTIQPKQHLIGEVSLTNIDLSLGQLWAMDTNMVRDMMVVITNALPGEFIMTFFGRTNAATDHTLRVTNAPGVTLNWVGSSTNGPVTLTVFSNSFLKVFGSVSTNSGATNVYITYLSDSIWPQRNQAIIASAGGSTSNLTVGGLIYNDRQKYTNHSNAQNVTNYAFVMLPANLLTNDGDMFIGEWDIMHQGGSDGTNQFFIGFGANTNIFNTGSITNNRNSSAKLRCEITRSGNSSQSIYCEYKVHNAIQNIWYGTATNAEISEVCGVTNILRMHGRKAGVNTPGNVGNHTNTQFKVWYQPANR